MRVNKKQKKEFQTSLVSLVIVYKLNEKKQISYFSYILKY